jgi:N-acetylmuramoyl-L-alanine amidase
LDKRVDSGENLFLGRATTYHRLMRARFWILPIVSLSLLLNPFFNAKTDAKPLKIVIDPGHGGRDAGAVRGNLQEKDIALKVGVKLKELLSSQLDDFEPTLTRNEDVSLSLAERALFAQKQNADLLLSIHVNASTDAGAHGTEIYFQNQLPPKEEEMFLAKQENEAIHGQVDSEIPSRWLGRSDVPPEIASILDDMERTHRIQESYSLVTQLATAWQQNPVGRLRSIRQAPFYLTSKPLMPSALIELGFISHHREALRMNNEAFQERLANNIYLGLKKFKELLDKQ